MKTKRAREAARPMALTPQRALWLELMPFYIQEAWLLDERKLKEWLDLSGQRVLISRDFYWSSRTIQLPDYLLPICHQTQGHKRKGQCSHILSRL